MNEVGKVNEPRKHWTWAEATKAIPFVRQHLSALREGYVRMMHLHRKSEKAATPDHRDALRAQVQRHATAAEADVLAIVQLGVVIYDRAWRGIALCPFWVVREERGMAVIQEAYLIYHDSRTTIDTYALASDLGGSTELFSVEQPLPQAWRKGGLGVLPVADDLEDRL